MRCDRILGFASDAVGKLLVLALLAGLLSVGGLAQASINFRNYSLHDPTTGARYDAPIYFNPGQPWGALPGAYAELLLVVVDPTFGSYLRLLGQTTFRTNSPETMPYLKAVDLNVPFHSGGDHPVTFIVRLHTGFPGGFPDYVDLAPITVTTPLGGNPADGGPPIPPPSIDGFQPIGCAEAITIVPSRSLHTVGDTVEMKLLPARALPLRGPNLPSNFPLFSGSSLTLTNVQEGDAGFYVAELYCPGFGIFMLEPFHISSTLVVVPPIEVRTSRHEAIQRFSFTSRSGVIYSLEKSEMLGPPLWQQIAVLGDLTGAVELLDTNAIGPQGFYRIVAQLPPLLDPPR